MYTDMVVFNTLGSFRGPSLLQEGGQDLRRDEKIRNSIMGRGERNHADAGNLLWRGGGVDKKSTCQ